MPGAEGNLTSLTGRLDFLRDLRYIRFDRSRINAVVDELRVSFGLRSRVSQGPGFLFQIAMIILAICLGFALFRGIQLGADCNAEQHRREEAEKREAVLKEKLDALEREYRDHLRADAQQTQLSKTSQQQTATSK
jgi:hypothetical protein